MQIKIPAPSPWPTDRLGVLSVAHDWYDSQLVKINEQAIQQMTSGEVVPPPVGETNLERPSSPGSLKDSVEYALAMNSINYMFWSKDGGEFQRYAWDGRVGALGMTAAFQKAWEDPRSALSRARDLGQPLNVSDIVNLFGDIPLPQTRADILNEILVSGRLSDLSDKIAQGVWDGQPLSAAIASEVATAFPLAYGDQLLKKSQLAISSVWREARSLGANVSCDLTAFADYQIPNVLRALGILEYDPQLAAQIDRGDLIDADGAAERAIRAASVLAVEQISQQQGVDVADVDYWIWLRRKEPQTPFHLTVTTAY